MDDEKKRIKVPPLRRKRRSLIELGPDSLTAALHWDKLAGQLGDQAPAEIAEAPAELGDQAPKEKPS